MTITRSRARELAGLLSEGLSFEDLRERLLSLAELLRALTDEEHRLSNADIRAVISAYADGWCPAENTVNNDLAVLRERGILGYRVHTSPSGSWMENERFPLAKTRMLLNAVQSSRFLTTEQCAKLQDDFIGMASYGQEDALLGEVFVVQRVRKERLEVFKVIDVVSQAIREKRKVEFEYTYSGFDGKPHVLVSDSGANVRIETPIGLVYSEGNYYLESYSEVPWRRDDQVTRSRVDRMYNVRVSSLPEDDCETVKRMRKTLARRVERETEMVGGTTRVVFLRVRADMTNVMFDKFGFGLKFAQFNGVKDAPDTTAITCVKAAQSFTFFRWLSSAGDGIVLVRPGSEARVKNGPWPADVKQRSHEELVADYDAMRAGYLEYLARASAPYE